MTHEGQLARVRKLAARRVNYQTKVAALDADLRAAVRAAFDAGLTAPLIAEAAGLSQERIYQLRDGRR